MSSSIAPSATTHFLGLSANTPQYEYQDKHRFLSRLDYEANIFQPGYRSEFLIFTGLNQSTFDRDFITDDKRFAFDSYFPEHEIIVIRMESHVHAYAHREVHELITAKIRDMKIPRKALVSFGAAHVQGDDRMKRADESYLPQRVPRGRSRTWPSLVIEVGYTEKSRDLAQDIRWWMTQSRGEVRNAITVAINTKYHQITIVNSVPNAATNDPQETFRTVLTQNAGSNRISVTNKSNWVITFDDVFLRPPQGQFEGNFVINLDEMKDFADEVWRVQDGTLIEEF